MSTIEIFSQRSQNTFSNDVGSVLKTGVVFLILNLVVTVAFAEGSSQCISLFGETKAETYKFENGHNNSLRQVMIRMRDFEYTITEFVDGLTPKLESKYVKDNSSKYRNVEALDEVLALTYKYEKILKHLIEHSDHMMMSPRIQMVPVEKRAQFIERYKQAYIEYAETFHQLVVVLESFKKQDPSQWDPTGARDLLMSLHTQMGNAHNRF